MPKRSKDSLTAKDKHKMKMLKYWGDPENDFINRSRMHKEILGITGFTFYKHFTPDEISEIEYDAVELRKKASSPQRARLYKALYKEAKTGNVKAIKEFLDRVEGKVKEKVELTGEGGEALVPIINVTTTGNKR